MSTTMKMTITIGPQEDTLRITYSEHPHTGGLRIHEARGMHGDNLMEDMSAAGLSMLYGIVLKKHRRRRQASDPMQPAREHIEELVEDSRTARVQTNCQLARDLYDMAEQAPDNKALKLMEAAERLAVAELTSYRKLGCN